MKQKIFRMAAAVAALAIISLSVYSCWEIKNVSIPPVVSANSEVTVTLSTHITPKESDMMATMVAMFCVPKSWNAQETAKVTYSTSGYVAAISQKSEVSSEIVDEELLPIGDDVLEYTTQQPFCTAFSTIYGNGGNYGDVEWVGFVAPNEYLLQDISGCAITGFDLEVKVTFKTDNVNYKFFLNSWLGETRDGTGSKYYASREAAEAENNEMCTRVRVDVMEVTGGSSAQDYTVPQMVSTVPEKFGFGDFFQVTLTSDLAGCESPLRGRAHVYLCAKAIFEDDSEVVVDNIDDSRLMIKTDNSYSKYILPSLFFNTPYEKKIKKIYVWFKGFDGTEDRCGFENGWELTPAAEE